MTGLMLVALLVFLVSLNVVVYVNDWRNKRKRREWMRLNEQIVQDAQQRQQRPLTNATRDALLKALDDPMVGIYGRSEARQRWQGKEP